MFGCSVGYFTDIGADFQSKMPVIGAVAHHGEQCYRLEIVVSNADCVQTSQLLSVYSQLDPRVRPLVIAFRYWAKVSTFMFVVLVCFMLLSHSRHLGLRSWIKSIGFDGGQLLHLKFRSG